MRKTALAIVTAAVLSAGINTSLWAESPKIDGEQMNGEQMNGEQMQGNTMDSKEPSQNPAIPNSPSNHKMIKLSPAMHNMANILPENYLEKEIITSNGESIGKINKLVISKEDNTVYAISGVGGFMGIGEKVVGIPVNKLRSQGDKLVLPSGMTEDSLKQDMNYEKSEFSAFEEKHNTSDY